jgi:hypothetical protein
MSKKILSFCLFLMSGRKKACVITNVIITYIFMDNLSSFTRLVSLSERMAFLKDRIKILDQNAKLPTEVIYFYKQKR